MFSQIANISPLLFLGYAAMAALIVAMGWELLKFLGFILKESFKDKDTKKK